MKYEEHAENEEHEHGPQRTGASCVTHSLVSALGIKRHYMMFFTTHDADYY